MKGTTLFGNAMQCLVNTQKYRIIEIVLKNTGFICKKKNNSKNNQKYATYPKYNKSH